MLNTNNIADYDTNIKQKEKKYSLATVLAWLYLKTIGRILPKRWSKWAENILYYDKVIVDNGVQTDALKAADKSIQVPELVEKESQIGTTSKNETTFQYMATQTDDLITVDESVQVDLKPKAAEENSEITSEDEGIYSKASSGLTDEDCSDIEMDNEAEFTWENDYEMHREDDEELNEQLEQELEVEYSHNALLEQMNKDLESQLGASCKNLAKTTETIAHLEEELTAASEKNKQLKLQLAKYEEDYTELKDISDQIEEELLSELKELRDEIKKNLLEIRKKDAEINPLIARSKELEQDKKAMNAKNETLKMQVIKLEDKIESEISNLSCEKKDLQSNINILTVQLQSAQQQLERKKIDLEGQLKDSSNKLSAAEVETKKLENEVTKLQEHAWTPVDDSLKQTFLNVIEMLKEELAKQEKFIEQLQEERKHAEDQSKIDIKKLQEEKKGLLAKIDSLKENLSIMAKQLEQQQLSNNQEQQELGKELKNVDKRLEDIDEKTKEQTEAKALDTVSRVSIARSTTKSTFSKLQNLPNKLLRNENIDDFLSKKNKQLKKSFPECEKKHFCHNALGKTVESLSNQDDGKFESKKLLELLESNLKKSAKEIIEVKVREVVNEHCNIRKNVDKELQDSTLKSKLLPSVNKCMEELHWDKKVADAIIDSVSQNFRSKNNSNLKGIVLEELVKGRMKFFSSNIELLQLALSIRDKFLSSDQKMCSKITGEKNEYQLTEKAKKEYTPNSSIIHTNIVNISSSSNNQSVARVGSYTKSHYIESR